MAEIRVNATGGLKLFDADDSHYAQIVAGTITSNTDVMTLGHAAVVMGTKLDMNGNNLILDANANTYLDTGTDDTIKVYVSGAEDLRIAANAINVLSGTTLTIDSGATITNSGTANGFGSADPSSADGDTLGTASAEWSDLYLADSSVIYFGNDQDTTLTHTDGTGLTLNSTNKLCFYDSALSISSSTDGQLDIDADTEVEITTTTVDLNGALDVSGTITAAGVIYADDATSTSAPVISFTGDTNTGFGRTEADGLAFYIGGSANMRYLDNKGLALVESAPQTTSLGALTLNQGSNDDFIVDLKSSDVAHGVTTIAETDSYYVHKKYDGGTGGNIITGFDENDSPFVFRAIFATGNTYKTSQGNGPFRVMCADIDGTGVTDAPSNANLFTVSKNISGTNCVFIVDEDGDIYYDGSAAAFDEHDDAQLVRAYDQYRAPDAVIQGKFDKFVQYNRQSLIDAKLIGDCPIEEEMAGTNKPLVSLTGMQRLHNGAIWQQYEKHQQLLEAVYDLAKEAVGEEKANAILDKHEVKRLQ